MTKFQSVLLTVWQEACRHAEIGESTSRMGAILDQHLPIGQILVRRLDARSSCLETVAVASPHLDAPRPNARTECSTAQMKRLLAWSRTGAIVRTHGQDGHAPLPAGVVPDGVEGDVLAGPLVGPVGLLGVLVLIAPAGRAYDDCHMDLMKVLLDPFSVALANDHQLREMAALREAAEADNRSLLARLGRKELVDTIVGERSGLKAVMERVELVARSDVPVLVFGDTGTGKELLARAIHVRSARRAGPVHRVNCGAISPELIDSELFGHEKGAFTGAVETRKGWFERADGGTLFLDEIGELPPAAQVRLLRILQDGWLERVGGHQPIKVDVRIVAATHRDLAAMVATGKFREDLWYRLAIFPIVLPPLRERHEDVPELSRHFAERAAIRFGLPAVMPTPEDVQLLLSYDWPGNVRELATVIDRAAILGNGRRLAVATALGASLGPGRCASDTKARAGPSSEPPSEFPSLDQAMRCHIEAALAATQGRVEGPHGAARLLKINPHTLRARMRKLGVDWSRFRT